MCHVLDVKPSSYYNWINRGISNQQINRKQCELLVRVAHDETKRYYGVERLNAHLTEQDYAISKCLIRRTKEEYGIQCCRPKHFKITINSNHNKRIYPNLLDQNFDTNRPNESWVSNITYI